MHEVRVHLERERDGPAGDVLHDAPRLRDVAGRAAGEQEVLADPARDGQVLGLHRVEEEEGLLEVVLALRAGVDELCVGHLGENCILHGEPANFAGLAIGWILQPSRFPSHYIGPRRPQI